MSSAFPTIRRVLRSRTCRVLPKVVLVLIILAGLAHVVLGLYWGSQVRAELRRIEAGGEPLAFADITPPPATDAENSYALYMRAAETTKPHMPQSNSGRNQDWTDAQVRQVRADLVREAAPAFDLIRQAAARPRFLSETNWSDGYAALLPQLSKMRQLGRFLGAAAVDASDRGDQAAASEYLRLGFVVARHSAEDPGIIAVLVACAIDSIMAGATQHVLSRGPIPEARALEIAAETDRVDYHHLAGQACRSERVLGIDLYTHVRRNESDILTEAGADSPGKLLFWLYAYPLRPLAYLDEREYLRSMRGRERAISAGPTQRPSIPDADQKAQWSSPPMPYLIAKLITPALQRFAFRTDQATTGRALVRTALGLELHRSDHGNYPASLAILRVSGWDVPTDIFTDGEFIYSTSGDDFTLYSVGSNAVDDGGKPVAWPSRGIDTAPDQPKPVDDDMGDIVWR